MHPVPIATTRRLADYAEIIGDSRYEELRALAKTAAGRSMLHVNATAYGGGVAEILQNLVPLLRDAGVDAHWAVLDAPPAFYDITKKVHNALQGMELDLSEAEHKLFLDVARENAAQLADADVVLAHDPQAVALRHFAKDPRRAKWVWRCHIDLTTAYQPVWSFLRPFVEEHDASIWTMPQFVRPDLKQRVLIQAPTIDPLSLKNQDMPLGEARAISAAREGIGAGLRRPALEAREALERVLRPADRFAELAVARPVDAELDLPAHHVLHGLREAALVRGAVVGLALLPRADEFQQRRRPDQAADVGCEDALHAEEFGDGARTPPNGITSAAARSARPRPTCRM